MLLQLEFEQGLEKLRNQVQAPVGSTSEGEKSVWMAEKKKEVDREAFKIFCFKAKAVSKLNQSVRNVLKMQAIS